MEFLNIGPPELILILVIALMVLGPERLPEIGASLGKAIREFRQMSQGLTNEINKELQEVSAPVRDVQKEVKQVLDPQVASPTETEDKVASSSKEEEPPGNDQSNDFAQQ